jgi:hypothetical protein
MNEIVVVDQKPMELSVQEVKSQVQKIQNLMTDLMKDGEHYGTSFPGDTKKNLLKPGADKLCFMFRLRPEFHQEIKNLPESHIEVLTRCEIYHIDSGTKIAEGVGLATTMESKYRWRNASRKCPECGKETIIKGKEEYGGGWICFAKKGGCGAKFRDDDPKITDQLLGKVENPDIADTYNTVIKMSKKRAYVDATITACAASDIFSQDAEDFLSGSQNAESLAGEAARKDAAVHERHDSSGENPAQGRNEILSATGAILSEKSPDEIPYFTETEVKQERAIAKGAADIAALENQYDRLKKLLKKRKAEYIPVPFEDNTALPDMYMEPDSSQSDIF